MNHSIKTATFQKSDTELVKQIEAYQHKKGQNSFIAAIRKLCSIALEFEKINNEK